MFKECEKSSLRNFNWTIGYAVSWKNVAINNLDRNKKFWKRWIVFRYESPNWKMYTYFLNNRNGRMVHMQLVWTNWNKLATSCKFLYGHRGSAAYNFHTVQTFVKFVSFVESPLAFAHLIGKSLENETSSSILKISEISFLLLERKFIRSF